MLSGSRARLHALQTRPRMLQDRFLCDVNGSAPASRASSKCCSFNRHLTEEKAAQLVVRCIGRGQRCARLTRAEARDSASTADARAWEIEK